MADVTAKFSLNNNNIGAKFDLSEENTVDAVFKIDAASTTWGSIDGDLSNQTDLQAALDLKADKTDLDADVELINQTINENYNTLDNKIDSVNSDLIGEIGTVNGNLANLAGIVDANSIEINNRVNTLETSLDADIEELNTHLSDLSDTISGNYTELSTAIQNEVTTRAENDTLLQGGINLLNNNLAAEISNRETADNTLQGNINTLSGTVASNYTTLDTKIDNTKTELDEDISTLSQTVSDNYTALNSSITSNVSTLNSRIDNEVSALTSSITDEAATRENADTNLQSQIDALTVASDVVDIVGTYAELQAYDTSSLPVNDIIKVLNDETHDNASSYYKWTGSVWDYIGSEGPYYTKSEANEEFVPQTRTINNKALSANITLSANDIGALPDTTVIGAGVLTVQKNGMAIDTFSANATADKSINIEVPTAVSELANDSGYLTSASLTDYALKSDIPTVTSELTNDSGFITSSALTNYALKSELPEDVSELNNDAGYITNSALTGYATENWVSNQNYVNGSTLSTTLNNYVLNTDLSTTLANYVTSSSLNTTLKDYVLNTDLSSTLAGYQPLLVSGENIKTVNGNSIVGSGNLEIDGLPSQTGNVGKVLTTDGTDASWQNLKTFDLFDFKWADHQLNDLSWLRADTFSWQSGDVYTSAYNHLVEDIQGITSETETIGSYTITFYRATDGHKIVLADMEQTVANIYSETGIAWYYVLDTDNARFKLPRTKFGFEGLRGNVGDMVEAGLPNITGSFQKDQISIQNPNEAIGCFSSVTSLQTYSVSAGGSGNVIYRVNFNASKSSSIYGNSSTVQEQSTQMYLYFYVGDYTQSAIEQTAGLNSELFNGKADVDLSNLSSKLSDSFFEKIMPDYENGITIASGFIAPSVGWVSINAFTNTNGQNTNVFINGIKISGIASGGGQVSNAVQFLVAKGSAITFNNSTTTYLFFPLKGAN